MPSQTSTSTSAAVASKTTTHDHIDTVTTVQLDQLDDTDYYATAWADAVRSHLYNTNKRDRNRFIKWGGKGQGGRGSKRRTYQPKDVILDHINLEYCMIVGSGANNTTSTSGTTTASKESISSTRNATVLLNDASLKLLNGGHIYAMIGSSGCGKSSFLRRIAAYKIPGFPTHITTLYIPQEMIILGRNASTKNDTAHDNENNSVPVLTPIDYIIQQYTKHMNQYQTSTRIELERLENEMDMLNVESDDDQIKLEELANCISEIEDELGISYETNDDKNDEWKQIAQDSLHFMNVDDIYWDRSIQELSEGVQKKITLAVAYAVCRSVTIDLLLLDEPTNGLDVLGLIKLRELISTITSSSVSVSGNGNNEYVNDDNTRKSNSNNNSTATASSATTILLVSHDIDFINSVATDIIDWYNNKLYYYVGNYADYQSVRQQHDARHAKQSAVLEKKRDNIKETISNLKKKGKNTRKQIESHKKKFTREIQQDFTNDEINGIERRRYGTGIGIGGDATGTSTDQPDKAIQFVFKKVTSQWHEPLITALDIGHTFDTAVVPSTTSLSSSIPDNAIAVIPGGYINDKNELIIVKKDRYIFDCIDLCIEEGSTYCIVGENSSGKTTLLKLLAKKLYPPTEGKIIHSNNVDVVYIDQEMIDSYLIDSINNIDNTTVPIGSLTALQYLTTKYPLRSNHEIRGELASFGLSNQQQVNAIPIKFLSGGERRRLCYTDSMLRYNHSIHVLVLDEPTCNLDADSVNALIYGLNKWNGTIIIVSHDCHFIRSLHAKCYLLSANEGKIRRIDGGIDAYLKSFTY